MDKNDRGQELHDRATRGDPLDAQEQAELERWYSKLDGDETELLAENAPAEGLTALRAQIDHVLSQLPPAVQQIQKLTAENDQVRREVAELKERLARSPAKTS